MKEIQNIQSDQTEVHAQKEVEKKLAYHGSFKLHKGQKVWQCNVATQEIKEAECEFSAFDFEKAAKGVVGQMRHKLIMREGCIYAPAINIATARKKFLKLLFSHYQNK
jgi:hypothetical protein